MSKLVVYVCEKPSVMRMHRDHIESAHPNDDVYLINNCYLGFYHFKYPHGLKFSECPIILDPQFKINNNLLFKDGLVERLIYCMRSKEYVHSQAFPLMVQVLKNADEIIFNSDCSHTSIMAFHTLLKQVLGGKADVKRQAVYLQTWHEKEVKQAFKYKSNTGESWFVNGLNYGTAKQYFDYNFNLNSLILFGEALRTVGVSTNEFIMTKYCLQLLYFFKIKESHSLSFSEILSKMHRWTGTGKYLSEQRCTLGSASSRHIIIEHLLNSGLIEKRENELLISLRGEKFLSLLHPDCCDQDLPYRLEGWSQDFEQSKPKMDRYLRTLFGKQKRYFAKHSVALNGKQQQILGCRLAGNLAQ